MSEQNSEENKVTIEEGQASILYSSDPGNKDYITFIIDNYYVITIDQNTPGQASWDILDNVLTFDPENEIPEI